jgi:transposase-like protein
MAKKRYSPKVKFQVVLEALTGEKTPGQIAKGVWHPSQLRRAVEEGVPRARGGAVLGGWHDPGV